MAMTMDNLKMGSYDVSVAQLNAVTGRMVAPKKMESSGPMVMVNYGISDRLALTTKIASLDKTMTSDVRMPSGSHFDKVTENNGITDLDLKLRYNLWRDDYYSKFITPVSYTHLWLPKLCNVEIH